MTKQDWADLVTNYVFPFVAGVIGWFAKTVHAKRQAADMVVSFEDVPAPPPLPVIKEQSRVEQIRPPKPPTPPSAG